MLEGVVDQVDQDLRDGLGVGVGFDRGIGELDFEGDVAFLGGGLKGLDDGADCLGKVDGDAVDFRSPATEAGMPEDVVDEQTQSAGFAEDETVVFLAAGVVFVGEVDEFLGKQTHGGEGGAQFVGDGRDEFGLLKRELPLAFGGTQGGEKGAEGGESREGDQRAEDPGLATLACVEHRGVGEGQGDREGREGGGGCGGERFAVGCGRELAPREVDGPAEITGEVHEDAGGGCPVRTRPARGP